MNKFKYFLILALFLNVVAYASCIQVITFDFGGVIGRTHLKVVREFVSQSLEISETQTAHILSEWRHQTQTLANQEQFWHAFAKSNGKTLPPNWLSRFKEVWCRAIQPMPGMLSLVEELQQMGYQTAMLSNTTPMHAEVIGKLGYYQYFYPVLLSYQINASKPDRRAFVILLEWLNRPASECLFIDDKEANVEAARALGIDSIQFFSAEQLKEELAKRGILVNQLTPNLSQ
jgi:HAD superfamily hydrolase (TIGR01509 family)